MLNKGSRGAVTRGEGGGGNIPKGREKVTKQEQLQCR